LWSVRHDLFCTTDFKCLAFCFFASSTFFYAMRDGGNAIYTVCTLFGFCKFRETRAALAERERERELELGRERERERELTELRSKSLKRRCSIGLSLFVR
jgi:hypothetical protein